MQLQNNCKICDGKNVSNSHYHKEHKITIKDYYAKYEPKFDILTGELIEFKSEEHYFLTDVNNKNNLKEYLEEKATRTEGLDYLTLWLKKRKDLKNLKYGPSHLELRTLPFPSVKFIEKFYGQDSYRNICDKVGLKIRYDYNKPFAPTEKEITVQVDTRESTPFNFSCNKIVSKLDIADYAPYPNPYSIFLERKSLNDVLSTLSGGFERFRAEMKRAEELKCNVIVVIECEFGNLGSDQYLKKLRFTKVKSDFVFKRMRDLLLEFPSVQIVCAGGRNEANILVEKILKLDYNPMIHDYQYLVDTRRT
jgi:hypothetical protein